MTTSTISAPPVQTVPGSGMTPCQVVTVPTRMPDGSIQHRVCLIPFFGPIPAQTQVLTSLQQLQQFVQPAPTPAAPTLIPSPQPAKTSLCSLPPVKVLTSAPLETAALSSTGSSHSSEGDSSSFSSASSELSKERNNSEAVDHLEMIYPRAVDQISETEPEIVEEETQSDEVTAEIAEEPAEIGLPSQHSPSPSTNQVEDCTHTNASDQSLVAETSERNKLPHQTVVNTNVQQTIPEETLESDTTDDAEDQPTSATETQTEPTPPAKDLGNEAEFPSLGGMKPQEKPNVAKSTTSRKRKAKIYKTLKRIRVRVDNTTTGAEVGILEKDTRVKLLYIEGRKGRIVAPLEGWVSMKKKKEPQLAQIFRGPPKVTVRNLDPSLKAEADVLRFLKKKDVKPLRCIWREKDDFCSLEFSKHKDALRFLKGRYTCGSTELQSEWADTYEALTDIYIS